MSLSSIVLLIAALMLPGEPPRPFGEDWPRLDDDATGEWWLPQPAERGPQKKKGGLQPPRLLVPRDEVLAFALYTHDAGTPQADGAVISAEAGRAADSAAGIQRRQGWLEAGG